MPLHPQAKAFVDELAAKGRPGWEALTPEQGRLAFAGLGMLFGEGPAIAQVTDYLIEDRVPVRLYADSKDANRPTVFYFHGGGWVLGDLNTHDALCRHVAKRSGCTVIAVDYRRSPEARFPAAIEDGHDAIRYVIEQSDQFDVDPQRVAVMGDSAGGNLATMIALRARDTNGPTIRLQVLIYPVIEPVFETSSYRAFASGFGLSRASMEWFWQQYLGDGANGKAALASPSRASSLKGLPRTHVMTAEYDVLRDEGEAYAERLREAGVPTTHRRYEGMLHGFLQFSGIFDVGQQALDDVATLLRTELNR